ncbi:MAG: hypothetical protein JXL81_11405 [Deltaproteobacteria bacterium]|nr:hypothetical protein [Deltaproteobacteria bacterium]
MFKVTAKAKHRLKRDLYRERTNNREFARIVYSPRNPARIGFEIDREKEKDMAIEDDDGNKLLLLCPQMTEILNTYILDYYDGPDEKKFTVKKFKGMGLEDK